jgi:flagellar basal body P-ring formation protein FlgA
MIRALVWTFAVLLALAGSAAAQAGRPALRASVTVDSAIVRIGDLIDNAGPVANVPIFRAPDLGTTGAVSTERVIEAIEPHQLIGIDTRGLAEVVVTRASRAISPQEISDRITQALSERYRLADTHNLSLNFDLPVHTLQVEAGATGELQVLALNYDARTGRFDATLDLPSSHVLQRQPLRLTGVAIETVDAVSVDRPIDRGEVLQASDLTVLRRPKAQAIGLADMAGAVGMAARRQLRPGQPIAVGDLMKPTVVQRNDTVTLVYSAPGLTLTLRGQAQDAGALGDKISVINPQTKRVVQGTVTGPGRVMVANNTVHLVDNAPETAPVSATAAPQRQE